MSDHTNHFEHGLISLSGERTTGYLNVASQAAILEVRAGSGERQVGPTCYDRLREDFLHILGEDLFTEISHHALNGRAYVRHHVCSAGRTYYVHTGGRPPAS